jgi:hypothetical protein
MRDGSGEKIEKTLDSPTASANGETLQNLSRKDEASDDQSGEELPNRQGRKKRDGHREFHRHLSFNDVLEGFLENWISADQGSRDADYTDVRKRPPKPKPDRSRSQGHKSNADEFSPLHPVPVFFVLCTEVRFLQFRRIPLLPEFGRFRRRLFDSRRRAHNRYSSAPARRSFQVRFDHVDHFISGYCLR